MALEGSVARRYAHALADLAAEAGVEEAVGNDLQRVLRILEADNAQLESVMANPGFTIGERRDVLECVFPPFFGLQPLVRNLLFLLLDKHRLAAYREVVAGYQEVMDTHAGRIRAMVSTAAPVSPALLASVKSALAGASDRPVAIGERVDPSLIAGIVVQVGDTVYDASLKTRLESMRMLLLDPTCEPVTETSSAR